MSSVRSATYAVVDVETTGIDPRHDRVVEVACSVVRGDQVVASFASLVDPQRTIPPPASAIHGIVGADVAGAPTLDEIAPVLALLARNAVVVAHNAAFDLAFLTCLNERRSLCTMRLAQLVFPDAPNFKNQTLRRYLGIAPPSRVHRAADDVDITRRILFAALARYVAREGDDLDALLARMKRPRPRVAATASVA